MKVKYRTHKTHPNKEPKTVVTGNIHLLIDDLSIEKIKKANPLDTLTSLFSCLSCLIALLTLFFTLYPQFKPTNTNYLEMANAGDIQAQVKLADLYYKTGQINNSLYWYEIASIEERDSQDIVLNNLACIYLNHSEYSSYKTNVYLEAMKMYLSALESGRIEVAENLYLLLISTPENYFGREYCSALSKSKSILSDYDDTLQYYDQFTVQWTEIETIMIDGSFPAQYSSPEYMIQLDAPLTLNEGLKSRIIQPGTVYKRTNTIQAPAYKYIDPNIK